MYKCKCDAQQQFFMMNFMWIKTDGSELINHDEV